MRSLKIAACSPKITIISKNCRLKITIISKNCRLKITAISKNYDLKIPVRVRICACVRVRMIVRTPPDQDQDQDTGHDRNTRPEKRGTTNNAKKPAYICMIADNEKKYKKS